MRQSSVFKIGLATAVYLSILSGVCLADELPSPGSQPPMVDPSTGAPLPPQNPAMPPPGGVVNPPQGSPNMPPGMGQQPGMPPTGDEEFPTATGTDKRKIQRFMNRIRDLEMRVAMLERRVTMMVQGGSRGGYPPGMQGSMQGGSPGAFQGGQQGTMLPGQSGPPGFFRPRGLSEGAEPGTGSSPDQPASSEPTLPDKQ